MHTATTAIILLTILASSASAATLGYHAVSLCPYNDTSTAAITWAGCSTSHSQSIFIDDFGRAQNNTPRYVPRSNKYALSVFRSSSVASAFLDFEITDAKGRTLVPRTQVALQSNTPTLSSVRRDGVDSELIQPKAPPKGKLSGRSNMGRLGASSTYMGRRKGKGIMGGIGGGGRYGGGTGGFRSASGGAGGKSYGYSSSAMGSRYAPGHSRTAYGYHGRSAMYVGAPMFLYAGHSHRGFYRGCDHYSGSDRSRCRQKYSRCTAVNSTGCIVTASSGLVRDDIMAATVDVTVATFPLNITIFNTTITFRGAAGQEPWETPLLLSFSEVDLDDENDPDMEFGMFCFLMSLAVVVLCLIVCFCWCLICDGECCCTCERGSGSEEAPPPTRTYSKELQEWDVEIGHQDTCSLPTVAEGNPVAQGNPMVGDIHQLNKDPEFVTPRIFPCNETNMTVVTGCPAPVIEGYSPATAPDVKQA